MNKLTDAEIVKAFECCLSSNSLVACWKCPAVKFDICCDGCYRISKGITNKVVDLINRQKAEIERLQSMNQAKLDTIHDLMAEVENLKKFCNDFSETLSNNCKKADLEKVEAIDKAKSEAIKEFAERLKEELRLYTENNGGFVPSMIDNLVKEMVGDENA